MRFGTAAAAAALAALAPLAAAAADMTPFSPFAVPASRGGPGIGAGWYLRGDASFGPEDRPELTARDGLPAFDGTRSAWGYAFGAGVGYRPNAWLRVDVTADVLDPLGYRALIPCGGACLIDQRSEVWRGDALVNGYVDLGTYAGFTPYVGAGVGGAASYAEGSLRVDGVAPGAAVDPRTGAAAVTRVPDRTGLTLAWAALAGVSYAVTPNLLVDVGYRYLDLGRTRAALPPTLSPARDAALQQVRVGLRYAVD